MKKSSSNRLNLRFDDKDLKVRIKAAAKKSRRSQNGEILIRLRRTFDEEREDSAAAGADLNA